MADERVLQVMYQECPVGLLKQDSSGQMEFSYSSSWLDSAGMFYPVYANRGKIRLSLAGAQDKLPVLCHANELFLPQGNLASSHILKFPNRDFKYLPENEVLTMRLAGECGLPVVETELHGR